jgi:hypothetical protein
MVYNNLVLMTTIAVSLRTLVYWRKKMLVHLTRIELVFANVAFAVRLSALPRSELAGGSGV